VQLVSQGATSAHSRPVRLQTTSPAELARRTMAGFPTESTSDDVLTDEYVPISAFDHVKYGQFAVETGYRSVACASVGFMLGAVEPPKIKVKAQRAAKKLKAPLEKEIAPDRMDAGKQEDSNETSKLTEAMYEAVVKHHKAPYVHFVLNHESFAQTIENMFSVAMLVGNAKVSLRAHPEWGMCVHMVRGMHNGQPVAPQPKGEPAQMVLNMNYTMHKALCEKVRREDCLTPHREAIDFHFGQRPAAAPAAARKQARPGLSSDDDDAPGPSKRARRW
jgi:Nse4 C-terminal